MPQIAEMITLADGRPAVVLAPVSDDEGAVTIWTEAEKQRKFAAIKELAREECAQEIGRLRTALWALVEWHRKRRRLGALTTYEDDELFVAARAALRERT